MCTSPELLLGVELTKQNHTLTVHSAGVKIAILFSRDMAHLYMCMPAAIRGILAHSSSNAEEALASTDMERSGMLTLPSASDLVVQSSLLLLSSTPITSVQLSADQTIPFEGIRPCQRDMVMEKKPGCLLKRSSEPRFSLSLSPQVCASGMMPRDLRKHIFTLISQTSSPSSEPIAVPQALSNLHSQAVVYVKSHHKTICVKPCRQKASLSPSGISEV